MNLKDPGKISEKTLVSMQLVIVIIGLTIWLIRLGDRVDAHDKAIAALQEMQQQYLRVDKRLYRIEEKLGVEHPREDQ